MRREPEFFENSEPRLVYIAKRLNESLKLEELLTQAGLDFGVEADRYRGGMIFQTERVGAFFYVRPESEVHAREFLVKNGYTPSETAASLEQ